MNPSFVTYIGFVVAILIILWAVVELARRFARPRKVTTQLQDRWLTVKSKSLHVPPAELSQQEDGDVDDIINAELQKRAKQNGHHPSSKNM